MKVCSYVKHFMLTHTVGSVIILVINKDFTKNSDMFLPILFCTIVFCAQWINSPSINFDKS